MAHLGDKLAEFFYQELPAADMREATRHVESCAECRLQVQQFEKTHLFLKTAPDVDPPRRVVFSAPSHQARQSWLAWLDWRSVAAASAAAAVLAGVVIRLAPLPPPVTVSMPAAAPVVLQSEKVDYARIVSEVRQSERAWMTRELDKRDKEIQRLQGELAYYENFQRAVMKETMENASSIQLLAARR